MTIGTHCNNYYIIYEMTEILCCGYSDGVQSRTYMIR